MHPKKTNAVTDKRALVEKTPKPKPTGRSLRVRTAEMSMHMIGHSWHCSTQ